MISDSQRKIHKQLDEIFLSQLLSVNESMRFKTNFMSVGYKGITVIISVIVKLIRKGKECIFSNYYPYLCDEGRKSLP